MVSYNLFTFNLFISFLILRIIFDESLHLYARIYYIGNELQDPICNKEENDGDVKLISDHIL